MVANMVLAINFHPLVRYPRPKSGILITVLLNHKGRPNKCRRIMDIPETPPIINPAGS